MHPRDLFTAIRDNHPDEVVRFINDVNFKEEIAHGETPIEWAAHLGHWGCVEVIAKNKKTNRADTARYGSALLNAVNANRLTTVKLLLESGAPQHWCYTRTGDGCLDIAKQKNNVDMITLLLYFDFHLKIDDPSQLPDYLKANGYLNAKFFQIKLAIVIQSIRQPHSAFGRIPVACSSLILSFLTQKTPKTLEKIIQSSANSFFAISANCFLVAYSGNMFQTSTSNRLVAELEDILEAPRPTKERINEAIDKFLKNDGGQNTRTLHLLYKYRLTKDSQFFGNDMLSAVNSMKILINLAPKTDEKDECHQKFLIFTETLKKGPNSMISKADTKNNPSLKAIFEAAIELKNTISKVPEIKDEAAWLMYKILSMIVLAGAAAGITFSISASWPVITTAGLIGGSLGFFSIGNSVARHYSPTLSDCSKRVLSGIEERTEFKREALGQ